jgi:hypothetical protein
MLMVLLSQSCTTRHGFGQCSALKWTQTCTKQLYASFAGTAIVVAMGFMLITFLVALIVFDISLLMLVPI